MLGSPPVDGPRAPDPEAVIGGGRALFRVADLLALEGLLRRLDGRESREACDGV
jgi:hypothetical protein